MTSEIWAALIATGVSFVVGGATVLVTHRSTMATLRGEAERQNAAFRSAMTERLYERRMATYPGLFDATSAFRRSKMRAAGDLRTHLQHGIDLVDEWQSKQGGLILSPAAHRCLRHLRHEVRSALTQLDEDAERFDREARIEAIWSHKNRLRGALRTDLGLLFAGEAEELDDET